MVLADVPKDINEELSTLINLGLGIEEIEYVIDNKLRSSQN